jgi:hypothetical protein
MATTSAAPPSSPRVAATRVVYRNTASRTTAASDDLVAISDLTIPVSCILPRTPWFGPSTANGKRWKMFCMHWKLWVLVVLAAGVVAWVTQSQESAAEKEAVNMVGPPQLQTQDDGRGKQSHTPSPQLFVADAESDRRKEGVTEATIVNPAVLFALNLGPCAPASVQQATPEVAAPKGRKKRKPPPPPPPYEPLNFTAGELSRVLPLLKAAPIGAAGMQLLSQLSRASSSAAVMVACKNIIKHMASPDAAPGPAFRRAAVATLLLAMVLLGDDAEADDLLPVVQRLVQQFTDTRAKQTRAMARPESAARAPIYLLHVSKAGGTSLCSLSHYNQCLEHPSANNCWVPGAGPVWFATFTHTEQTCEQYSAMMTEHKLDLMANEGYLDGGVDGKTPFLCTDMLYITMLREPMSRVVSHMFQAGVKPGGFTREQYAELTVAEKITQKPEIASNYMTRVMLGKDAYQSGLDELTAADAERAAVLLGQFDVILILEQKRWTPPILENMLGWWNASDLDRRHGRKAHQNRTFTPEEHKMIADANEADAILYTAAVVMFKLDLVLFACGQSAAEHSAKEASATHLSQGPLTCSNPNRVYPKK